VASIRSVSDLRLAALETSGRARTGPSSRASAPRLRPFLAAAAALTLAATFARAEDPAPAAPATETAPAGLTAEQLEELVGPVALYPDAVLSAVLPASTNPVQVVQVARWVASQGGAVTSVPEDKGWDPAVQSLVQWPDVLAWMDQNLEWTEQLGYAVSNQQPDVLKAIQSFRAKAVAAGNLKTDDKMIVVVQETTQVVQVVPTNPEVVYVPVYEPVVVVQPAPPSYPGLAFATGVAVGVLGAWAWHELVWDDDFHVHVHGSPYHWDAEFNRNVEVNVGDVNVNVGNDVRVGNSVNGGQRWNTAKPVARPATLPANGSPASRSRSAVARPAPATTSARATSPRGPVAAPSSAAASPRSPRPGASAPASRSPGAFDASSGGDARAEAARGRDSLDGNPPRSAPASPAPANPSPAPAAPSSSARTSGGAFGGASTGSGARAQSERGSRSLGGGGRRPPR
jgi:hypothetical protein